MKAHTLSKFTIPTIFAFVCVAIPAFANHGGGGGGAHGGSGGFHGGGGFRGGVSSAPRASGGYSRGASSAPAYGYGGARSAGNDRSGASAYRSYSAPSTGGQRTSNYSSASRGVADGQWHSFGEGSADRAAAGSTSEARGPASTGGGWQVFSGNRSGAAGGTANGVRSFSGQGRDVWENAPADRNTVSSSQRLSSIHNSFASSAAGSSGLRSNSSLAASSPRLAAGTAFGHSLGANTFAGFGGGYRFGYPFRGGLGFGGGCWGCFGFGFGLGWWPGWGFGFGWPGLYWDDPWLWGSPGYGYMGYGYGYPPPGYIYGDPYAGDSTVPQPSEEYPGMDSGAPPMDQNSNQGVDQSLESRSDQGSGINFAQGPGVQNTVVPVLLYLKSGAVYSARDYWVSGGQLHIVLLSGSQTAIDINQLDVQRTVNENARSGVQFTLKPGPSSFGPVPTAPPAEGPAPRSNLTLAPGTQL